LELGKKDVQPVSPNITKPLDFCGQKFGFNQGDPAGALGCGEQLGVMGEI